MILLTNNYNMHMYKCVGMRNYYTRQNTNFYSMIIIFNGLVIKSLENVQSNTTRKMSVIEMACCEPTSCGVP